MGGPGVGWGGGERQACLGLRRRTRKKCVSGSQAHKISTHCCWCPGAAMSIRCADMWQHLSQGSLSLLCLFPHGMLTSESSQGAGWQGQTALQRGDHLGAQRTLPSHHVGLPLMASYPRAPCVYISLAHGDSAC